MCSECSNPKWGASVKDDSMKPPYYIGPRLPVSRPIFKSEKIKFSLLKAAFIPVSYKQMQFLVINHTTYKESEVLKIALEESVLKKLNIYPICFLGNFQATWGFLMKKLGPCTIKHMLTIQSEFYSKNGEFLQAFLEN